MSQSVLNLFFSEPNLIFTKNIGTEIGEEFFGLFLSVLIPSHGESFSFLYLRLFKKIQIVRT